MKFMKSFSVQRQRAREHGGLMAKLLAGAWRAQLSVPDISPDDLVTLAPLLIKSGGGPLTWRRISQSALRETSAGLELRELYRFNALQTELIAPHLARPLAALQNKGVKALLGKGWAIAQLYPEPCLRPYGDLDLYVRHEDYAVTRSWLQRDEAKSKYPVDLHNGLAELDDRSFDELYERSQRLPIGGVEARAFGVEDHLRLLCLHMLREGALRPLWLCDIAVALETRPAHFDWNYFLSGHRRRTDWIACALGLAHKLLDAVVDDTPIAARAKALPRWLAPTVLHHWGDGTLIRGRRSPLLNYWFNPVGLPQALRLRWPNAIEATVGVSGPFNNWPRWPFQLGDCLTRGAQFALHLPKELRR